MELLYILQTLRESSLAFLVPVMVFVSECAVALGPALIIIWYIGVDKKQGMRMLFGYSFANVFSNVAKVVFCVDRPWILDKRLHIEKAVESSATGYSFPSGHTTTAASVFYNVFFYLKKNFWKLMSVLIILLVAFSRMFLGAHSLLDVSFAIVFSVICCIVNNYIFEKTDKSGNDKLIIYFYLFVAVMGFLIVLLSPAKLMSSDGLVIYDIDQMKKDGFGVIGLILAALSVYYFDESKIRYQVNCDSKIKDSLIALILFISLYLGIFRWLSHQIYPGLGSFIRNYCSVVITLALYPYILSKKRN